MQTNWSMSYVAASTLGNKPSSHVAVEAESFFFFLLQPALDTLAKEGQCFSYRVSRWSQYTRNKSQSVLKTSAEVDASNFGLSLKSMWQAPVLFLFLRSSKIPQL